MKINSLTLEQIKGWNLNINQLKNYLALEIKRSEELQAQLRDAEIELSKVKADKTAFHSISIKNFKVMTQAENNFEKNALIAAIKNLRDQNLQLMAQIGKTKAQTKELKESHAKMSGSDMHLKYARVMEGLSSRQADIRNTWDSSDVLEIDDYVMENGVSYDEALVAIEEKLAGYKGEAVSDEE